MNTPLDIPFTLSGLRKAGMTQAQIGVAIGLKQPTISAMEAGKDGITRPSHKVISGLEALALQHGVCTSPPKPRKPTRRTSAPP